MKKTPIKTFKEVVRGREVIIRLPMGVAASTAPISAKATSFATLKDLEAYIRCLLRGGSQDGCYRYGDNGRGSWGDLTAQLKTPMCAIPPAEMIRRWGTSKAARGKLVQVLLKNSGPSVICEVRDKGPDGVVDLNPAALLKLGLPSDTELDAPAEWSWL